MTSFDVVNLLDTDRKVGTEANVDEANTREDDDVMPLLKE